MSLPVRREGCRLTGHPSPQEGSDTRLGGPGPPLRYARPSLRTWDGDRMRRSLSRENVESRCPLLSGDVRAPDGRRQSPTPLLKNVRNWQSSWKCLTQCTCWEAPLDMSSSGSPSNRPLVHVCSMPIARPCTEILAQNCVHLAWFSQIPLVLAICSYHVNLMVQICISHLALRGNLHFIGFKTTHALGSFAEYEMDWLDTIQTNPDPKAAIRIQYNPGRTDRLWTNPVQYRNVIYLWTWKMNANALL